MTDFARGPLGAIFPATASLPDPAPLPVPDQGRILTQDTDLDCSQTEQWESEGGAVAHDAGPVLHLARDASALANSDPFPLTGLRPWSSALRVSSRAHLPNTYEQKLERTRQAFAAAEACWAARAREAPLTRDDEGEEPASKAEANRARVEPADRPRRHAPVRSALPACPL
jgi:hypothetical protein